MSAQNSSSDPTLAPVRLDLGSPTPQPTALMVQAAEVVHQMFDTSSSSGSDSDSDSGSDSDTNGHMCIYCRHVMVCRGNYCINCGASTAEPTVVLPVNPPASASSSTVPPPPPGWTPMYRTHGGRNMHQYVESRRVEAPDPESEPESEYEWESESESESSRLRKRALTAIREYADAKRGRQVPSSSTGTPSTDSSSEEEVVIPRTTASRAHPIPPPWYASRRPPTQPGPWLTPRRPTPQPHRTPTLIDLTCAAVECPCCCEPASYLINCGTKNCHYGLCADCRTQILISKSSRCPSCRVVIY
jgi:hypothetical protein